MGRLLLAIGLALCAFGAAAEAEAQTFPSRTITIIVPFPPGGSTDTVARIMAEKMQAVLGQPVIIENVGGAGGTRRWGASRARRRTATPSTSASGTRTSAASSTSST